MVGYEGSQRQTGVPKRLDCNFNRYRYIALLISMSVGWSARAEFVVFRQALCKTI